MFIWSKESTLFLYWFYTSAFKFSIVRCIRKSVNPPFVLLLCSSGNWSFEWKYWSWGDSLVHFHILHFKCFNLVGYDLYQKWNPILVVTSSLPALFIKLPLWAVKLQKCHSWASNVGPFTQMTWKWCGNDVAMMWPLSSTEYWCPSFKIASP